MKDEAITAFEVEVLKRRGPAPPNVDHERLHHGTSYRIAGTVVSGRPLWIGRSAEIDLGEIPFGADDVCPRHCIQLRLSDDAELRQGSVGAGRTSVQALSIDPAFADQLVPWEGEVDAHGGPIEAPFRRHVMMRVSSRSLWIDLPFLGCKVAVQWRPGAGAPSVVPEDHAPSSVKTVRAVRSTKVRDLLLDHRWPQNATVHFMIVMSALDALAAEGSLDEGARAVILNQLTEDGDMESRYTDVPWTALTVRRKQKLSKDTWAPEFRTFDEFAADRHIPAASLDGVYRKALKAGRAHLSSRSA